MIGSTCKVPWLPSSSEMLVSMAIRFSQELELASPGPQEREPMPQLNFSLSRLEEQLEPQSAIGLGLPAAAAADSRGGSTCSDDRAAFIRNSSPLSGDFNVHCENSRVVSLMSKVTRFSFFTARCFSNLHQSHTQLPESTPSADVQQYLKKHGHDFF